MRLVYLSCCIYPSILPCKMRFTVRMPLYEGFDNNTLNGEALEPVTPSLYGPVVAAAGDVDH